VGHHYSRGQYLGFTPELQEELGRARTTGASSERRVSEPPPASGDSPGATELKRVLEEAGGSMTQAANRLGLSRHQLRRLMKTHGLVKRFASE